MNYQIEKSHSSPMILSGTARFCFTPYHNGSRIYLLLWNVVKCLCGCQKSGLCQDINSILKMHFNDRICIDPIRMDNSGWMNCNVDVADEV